MRTITQLRNDGLQYVRVLPAGSETLTDKMMRFIKGCGKKLDRMFLSVML